MLTTGQLVGYNLIFMAGWSALTVLLIRNTGRSHEYVSRVVSLVHALISCMVCPYAIYRYYPEGDFCGVAKDWELIGISVTFAYFAVDAVGMVFSNFFDLTFMLHHFISLGGFLIPMVTRANAYEVIVVIIILEFSNPTMHLHWLLAEHSMKANREPSTLQVFVRRGFYVCFFIGRFILGPWSLYEVSIRQCTYWVHAIIGTLFAIFSFQFYFNLMFKVRRGESWR